MKHRTWCSVQDGLRNNGCGWTLNILIALSERGTLCVVSNGDSGMQFIQWHAYCYQYCTSLKTTMQPMAAKMPTVLPTNYLQECRQQVRPLRQSQLWRRMGLYGQPILWPSLIYCCTNNGFGTNGDGNGFKLGSSGQSVPHTVTNCIRLQYGAWLWRQWQYRPITTTGSTGTGNSQSTLFYGSIN